MLCKKLLKRAERKKKEAELPASELAEIQEVQRKQIRERVAKAQSIEKHKCY